MPGLASWRLTPPSYGHRIITKDTIDISKLPLSYRSNTPKEEHLLQVADSFSRQYSHLCPDRVPLFLHPLNECDVPVRPGCGGQDSRGWRQTKAQTSHGSELTVWGQHKLKCQQPQQAGACGGLETPYPT